MRKKTIENVRLTLICDDIDGIQREQVTEGFGLRKNDDREFIFTKAPRPRAYCKRNPRIYSGMVVHSSLRKDGKYGVCACIDLAGDFKAQEKLALRELKEMFKKLKELA